MKKITTRVIYCILRIINSIIYKDSKKLMFIPHPNCKNDRYDIINSNSDNVLKLCKEILTDKSFDDYEISIVYYDYTKIKAYQEFVGGLERSGRVNFVFSVSNMYRKYSFLRHFFKTKITFVADISCFMQYKTKKQKVVCLGYYTPFKDDSWVLIKDGEQTTEIKRKIINRIFDHQITTSDLSARIISIDELVHYKRILPLGFPRNDVFYNKNNHIREKIQELVGFPITKIICYTPTYRDYERQDLYLGDSSVKKSKTIWGNSDPDMDVLLHDILKKNNVLLITKLHPWQEKFSLKNAVKSRM